MAQEFIKDKLSWSTNGKNISVTGTATGSANTIHTAVTSTTNYDELWITATNISANPVDLTIEFGWTTTADQIVITIPAKSWAMLVIPWELLNNSLLVKAFAETTAVININWYIHSITNS